LQRVEVAVRERAEDLRGEDVQREAGRVRMMEAAADLELAHAGGELHLVPVPHRAREREDARRGDEEERDPEKNPLSTEQRIGRGEQRLRQLLQQGTILAESAADGDQTRERPPG